MFLVTALIAFIALGILAPALPWGNTKILNHKLAWFAYGLCLLSTPMLVWMLEIGQQQLEQSFFLAMFFCYLQQAIFAWRQKIFNIYGVGAALALGVFIFPFFTVHNEMTNNYMVLVGGLMVFGILTFKKAFGKNRIYSALGAIVHLLSLMPFAMIFMASKSLYIQQSDQFWTLTFLSLLGFFLSGLHLKAIITPK